MDKNTQKEKNSYFFTFEGIEGAGKSTVIKEVADYFIENSFNVFLCREPGGTLFGEGLRKIILESTSPIHPYSEALLFAASRAQLLTDVILKELEKERTIVLCDRYIDSSLAYQGTARGLGFETILAIHAHPPLNFMPDQTFYLNIDLQTSQERQRLRKNIKDYFEKEKEDFYKKLIEGYSKAAKHFPERIKTINAQKEKNLVVQEIKTHLKALIPCLQ